MALQLSVQKIIVFLFSSVKKHTNEEYSFSREVSQADYMYDSVRLAEILQWERSRNAGKRETEQDDCIFCLVV